MKASAIANVTDIDELKSLGAYLELKRSLEGEFGNKLGVNGWQSFFYKLSTLKQAVFANKDYLVTVCQNNSFNESKKLISNLLSLRVTARGWNELNGKLKKIITVFSSDAVDPYEYYEKTKQKKFIDSSKLEGLDVEVPDASESLESVLARFRR